MVSLRKLYAIQAEMDTWEAICKDSTPLKLFIGRWKQIIKEVIKDAEDTLEQDEA